MIKNRNSSIIFLVCVIFLCVIIFISSRYEIFAKSFLDKILDWAIENAGMDSDAEEADAAKEYAKDSINPNKVRIQ